MVPGAGQTGNLVIMALSPAPCEIPLVRRISNVTSIHQPLLRHQMQSLPEAKPTQHVELETPALIHRELFVESNESSIDLSFKEETEERH